MDSKYRIEFSLNDTIFYTSNLGNVKQYYVKLFKSGNYTCSQTGSSLDNCVAYYDYEAIAICELNDSSCSFDDFTYNEYFIECPECIVINKRMDSDPIDADDKKLADPTLSWKNIWKDKLSNSDKYFNSININNKTYTGVYRFSLYNDSLLQTVYYNFKFGIVGITTISGETWNIATDFRKAF